MKHPCYIFVLAALLFSTSVLGLAPSNEPINPGMKGLVVTKQMNQNPDGVGFQEKDFLISWRQVRLVEGEEKRFSGFLHTPLDLFFLEIEVMPRGPVQIIGESQGAPALWTLFEGSPLPEVEPAGQDSGLEFLKKETAMPLESKFKGLANVLDDPKAGQQSDLRVWALARFLNSLSQEGKADSEREALLHQIIALYLQDHGTPLAKTWWAVDGRPRSDKPDPEILLRSYSGVLKALAKENSLPLMEALLLNQKGGLLYRHGEYEEASPLLKKSLEIRRTEAPGSDVLGQGFLDLGLVCKRLRDSSCAIDNLGNAVSLLQKTQAQGDDYAEALRHLGLLKMYDWKLDEARELFLKLLAVREKQEPGSIKVADALNYLGNVEDSDHNLEVAENYYLRTIKIQNEKAPNSMRRAKTINNLGLVAMMAGDLEKANRLYLEALTEKEKIEPGSVSSAFTLNNLGIVARNRGDLEAAENFYRQALAIRKEKAPGRKVNLALNINNLGLVLHTRRDMDGAHARFSEALEILSDIPHQERLTAGIQNNLGMIAKSQNHISEARQHYQHALKLYKDHMPDSIGMSQALLNLGNLSLGEGDLVTAKGLFLQALSIVQKLAPGSLGETHHLSYLALILEKKGEFAEAQTIYQKCLLINQKIAPGSFGEASALRDMARINRLQDRPEEGLVYLEKALVALESQMVKLGGSRIIKEQYGASNKEFYLEYIDLLMSLDRKEQAFNALERSRAQSLREMLAQRDLDFSRDLPGDLDQRQRLLAVQYDRLQDQMTDLSPEKDAEKMKQLKSDLQNLREQRALLQQEIRQASPQLDRLQNPGALELEEALNLLDEGTLAVLFSLDKEQTHLFILGPEKGAFRVEALPYGEAHFARMVNAMRQGFLVEPSEASPELNASGLLSEQIIKPLLPELKQARRLLIGHDGPLHLVPFAAIKWPQEADPEVLDPDKKQPEFLGQALPIHRIVSLGIYQQIKQQASAHPLKLAAFGDPKTSRKNSSAHKTEITRFVLDRAAKLAPLPNTRKEIEALAKLWPKASQIFLAEAATESALKDLPDSFSIIHVATHGLIDPDFPLDSALVFSLPAAQKNGQDNGFLQAWEVFEQVRLKADLVVLSACETGLGKDLGGEGIVGLSRAFQFAGARSLLVSLWSIPDRSTAMLMEHFYQQLKAGHSKDVALQKAQQHLRDNGYVAPRYWAPFVLVGDWQ